MEAVELRPAMVEFLGARAESVPICYAPMRNPGERGSRTTYRTADAMLRNAWRARNQRLRAAEKRTRGREGKHEDRGMPFETGRPGKRERVEKEKETASQGRGCVAMEW